VRPTCLCLRKWLGLLLGICGCAVRSGAVDLLVVEVTTGYLPPEPVQAVVLLVAEATVLLTLTLALSTRISSIASGIIAVVLFGVTWILGIVGGIGDAFDTSQLSTIGAIGRTLLPTDALWRGAVFHLEPAAVLLAYSQAGRNYAAIFPFAATEPLAPSFIAWCGAWIVIVLSIGWWSFRRREL
jgi:ABC-type transport system involved in multi-copper enzyme maturation permease subunit